jgi:Trypsin-like peptidase domain
MPSCRPSWVRLPRVPAEPARLRLLATLGLALLLGGAGGVPPDWPWSAVGRVLTDGGGPCSGVLVGPALILTVGHCVAGGRDWRPTPLARLRVAVGGREHAVTSVRLEPTSPFGPDGKPRDLRHDWALLDLAEPSMVPPVPYGGATAARRAYATDEPLTKVGWQPLPAGFASRLSDPDCRIADLPAEARLLVYRCPDGAGSGRSGSALLLPAGEGWEVVAVQSAIASPGGIVSGIAVVPEGLAAR